MLLHTDDRATGQCWILATALPGCVTTDFTRSRIRILAVRHANHVPLCAPTGCGCLGFVPLFTAAVRRAGSAQPTSTSPLPAAARSRLFVPSAPRVPRGISQISHVQLLQTMCVSSVRTQKPIFLSSPAFTTQLHRFVCGSAIPRPICQIQERASVHRDASTQWNLI